MNEFIVILDLETSGLDPANCQILEIGILIANLRFEVIAKKNWLIDSDVRWEYINETVRAMHNKRQKLDDRYSSLVEDINEAKRVNKVLSPIYATNRIIGWLESYEIEAKTHALTGATIGFDRGFLHAHMQLLDEWFDYHSVDISSIQIAIEKFGDKTLEELHKPSDRKMHRAIPDCEDSLVKYQWEIELLQRGILSA